LSDRIGAHPAGRARLGLVVSTAARNAAVASALIGAGIKQKDATS
jgi:hypothetical protein